GTNVKFFEDRAGQIFIASQESGLCWIRTNDTLSSPVLKSDKGISAIFEDREGNIWVGTSEGLYRLRPRRIRAWTTLDGLPDDRVKSVCAGPDGSVWAGTERGLAHIREGHVQTFVNIEPGVDQETKPIWADDEGG